MSWELGWRFQAIGGAVPGGAWLLLGLLAVFWLVLVKEIRPTGALSERGLWPTGLAGSVLLVGAFLLLRAWLTAPASDPRLAIWPFAGDDPARGHAEAALLEESVAEAGRGADLVVCRFLLPPGVRTVDGAGAADSLMEALDLRWLLSGDLKTGACTLWERRWGLLRRPWTATDADGPRPAGFLLLVRAGLLDEHAPLPALPDEWLPLYEPISDSAEVWLRLPRGPLPLRQDLRRASLGVQLGAPEREIVPAVNRALAADDSAGCEPWLLAARWFARQGEWETVRQSLTNALAMDPSDPRTHWLIAHLNEKGLKEFGYDSRIDALGRALALQPAFRDAALAVAPRQQDLRRGGEAAAIVDRALCALPRDVELRLLRGNLAYSLMDHARAQALYEALATDVPDDPRVWLNLGQLHYTLGQWALAAGPLEKAIQLGSAPGTLQLLGVCRSRLGQRDAAIDLFRRRMRLGGDAVELERTRRELAALFPDGPTTAPADSE